MPLNGVQILTRNIGVMTECLEAVSPTVIGRHTRITYAHVFSNPLRNFVSDAFCGRLCLALAALTIFEKQMPAALGFYPFQKTLLNEARMDGNVTVATGLHCSRFRGNSQHCSVAIVEDILAPKLGYLTTSRARVGADPRYPSVSHFVAFTGPAAHRGHSESCLEYLPGLLICEALAISPSWISAPPPSCLWWGLR